jgi:hypothetical protein
MTGNSRRLYVTHARRTSDDISVLLGKAKEVSNQFWADFVRRGIGDAQNQHGVSRRNRPKHPKESGNHSFT